MASDCEVILFFSECDATNFKWSMMYSTVACFDGTKKEDRRKERENDT